MNILFIMTDDHTVAEMSCAGNAILQTPSFDRLAREGVRFTNAFCTNALCAPSRAAVLTGAFSHVNGIRGNSEVAGQVESLDPSVATFPQLLQSAGYQTALVGKYHIRQDPKGFDTWTIHPGQGEYFDPEFIHNGETIRKEGYATDITGDLALEFLEGRDSDRPFCLVYQFKAPHRPFTPAPRHANLFEDVTIPVPATYEDDYATRKIAGLAEDMKFHVSLERDYDDIPDGISESEKKDWIYQRFIKDRYRTLLGVDENIGRVLDYLDANDLTNDTLVIYTSAHGYFCGEHDWYDKRFMYDPAMRIPLLIRPPRGVADHVADEIVMNVDYAATILDYCDLETPDTVQGRSLKPILDGAPPANWRDTAYYHYYENSWELHGKGDEAMAEPYAYFTPHRVGPHRGIRTKHHKLIHYYSEDYWELFDLVDDPDELRNRFSDPATQPLVTNLQARLQEERERYGDVN